MNTFANFRKIYKKRKKIFVEGFFFSLMCITIASLVDISEYIIIYFYYIIYYIDYIFQRTFFYPRIAITSRCIYRRGVKAEGLQKSGLVDY